MVSNLDIHERLKSLCSCPDYTSPPLHPPRTPEAPADTRALIVCLVSLRFLIPLGQLPCLRRPQSTDARSLSSYPTTIFAVAMISRFAKSLITVVAILVSQSSG